MAKAFGTAFAVFFLIHWHCFMTASAYPTNREPIATLRNGSYRGLHSEGYRQDFFLGVPFAQPPLGDLRLRVPESLNSSWTTARNATEYGPACYGYGEDTAIGAANYVSEDCLTLNIVRPAGYADSALPVGVWIYGGGFYEGSSLDQRYNLSFIVEQSVEIGKPFIAVSINYRLQGWGWLYSDKVVEAGVANLGLRDQRLALHWLQENIGAFGGDPQKVTIWGESALTFAELAQEAWTNVTEATGCSKAPDKLACLRLVPTEKLNDAFNSTTTEDDYSLYWGPLIDGDIVARGGNEQLLDGSFVKVPYILGENSDDGTDFSPFGLNSDAEFFEFYQGYDIDNETLTDLLELYPNDALDDIPASFPGEFNQTIGLQFKRSATLIGDIAFKAPRRLAAQEWNKYTDAPLYSYRFNAIPNGVPDYYGVTHWQEVPFMLHNVNGYGFPNVDPPYFGPDPFANRSESYVQLATLMSRMWSSFIYDGNPNFLNQNAPTWPPYFSESPVNFVFDANVTSHLEPDTYREESIQYLVEKYRNGTNPWGPHRCIKACNVPTQPAMRVEDRILVSAPRKHQPVVGADPTTAISSATSDVNLRSTAAANANVDAIVAFPANAYGDHKPRHARQMQEQANAAILDLVKAGWVKPDPG
ncbi:MAG: hypothetical protein M1819_000462 [Sarea resinae]|nr:MAG: hypothetical protein M1819_000462 [Sarea resinae]